MTVSSFRPSSISPSRIVLPQSGLTVNKCVITDRDVSQNRQESMREERENRVTGAFAIPRMSCREQANPHSVWCGERFFRGPGLTLERHPKQPYKGELKASLQEKSASEALSQKDLWKREKRHQDPILK